MADLNVIKPEKVQRMINKFCCTIGMLPTSYKASLTYEEQILAIGNYLETVVYPAINQNAEALEELQGLFTALQDYVNNYFDNLDVQEEINTKLEDMAESGELEEIIATYLDTKAVMAYDTVNDMINAETIQAGMYARTYGQNTLNDKDGAFFKIRNVTAGDIVDNYNIIEINENLIAERMNLKPTIYSFDTVNDMTNAPFLKNGMYVETLGYYSKNDNGAALYKIRNITNDDIVDGSFIIEMADDNLIAEFIKNGNVNLLQLGAKNDNSADISTILNNAINKLNIIYIPSGIYRVSNDIILKDNLCLRGEDKPQLLVKNTAQVKLNANASSNYYCNLYNINFRFSGVRETFGIDLHDLVYSTIEDCTFRSDDGETTYNGMRLIKEAGECYDNTISNCFFQRNALTLERSTDNFIINNKIWANNIVGHALDLIGNCGNNLIKGNHIIGGTQGGINASDMIEKNQIRIVDNYFDTGVKGITGKTYRACIISNNIFFNMTSNPIEIQQLFSSTLANNSFYQNGVTTKYSNINITYNHGGNTFANNVHFRQNIGDTNNKPPYYIVENSPIADSVVIGDNETFTSLFARQTGSNTFHFKNCYPTVLFPSE